MYQFLYKRQQKCISSCTRHNRSVSVLVQDITEVYQFLYKRQQKCISYCTRDNRSISVIVQEITKVYQFLYKTQQKCISSCTRDNRSVSVLVQETTEVYQFLYKRQQKCISSYFVSSPTQYIINCPIYLYCSEHSEVLCESYLCWFYGWSLPVVGYSFFVSVETRPTLTWSLKYTDGIHYIDSIKCTIGVKLRTLAWHSIHALTTTSPYCWYTTLTLLAWHQEGEKSNELM